MRREGELSEVGFEGVDEKVMAGFFRAYQPTRTAFLKAADLLSKQGSLKLNLHSHPTSLRGPESEPLFTDLCTFSATPAASKLLLITTGVHGCELFSGSAVVREFMARVAQRSGDVLGDVEVAVVHAVNPFGAAWLRRPNEHNVDLNRNCLLGFEEVVERLRVGEEYAWVRELDQKYSFNDSSHPSSFPRLALSLMILRESFPTLRNYFFCANRSNPHAINYGGATLQAEVTALCSLLNKRVFHAQHGYKEVVHLDIHTAVGPYGESTVIVTGEEGEELTKLIPGAEKNRQFLGKGKFPMVDGLLIENLRKFLPNTTTIRWRALVEEYGTYSNLPVYFAQLNEYNDYYRNSPWVCDFAHGLSTHMNPTYTTSDVKQRFVEVMCPHSPAWERKVLQAGLSTLHSLLKAMR